MSRSKLIFTCVFIVLVLSGAMLNANPIYTYNKSYDGNVTYDSDTNTTTIELNAETGGFDRAEVVENFDFVESGEFIMDYTISYEIVGPPLEVPHGQSFAGSIMVARYGGPYYYPFGSNFYEDTSFSISDSVTFSYESGTYIHWNALYLYGPSNAVFSYKFRTATTPLPPNISVTPLTWDFGNVAWMGSPRSADINIANTGGEDLNVSDASLVDPLVDFSIGTLDTNVIAPDTSADLEVSFAPTYLGYQEGTLQISSDDPDEPEVYIALSGVGVLSEETDEQVEAINTFIVDEVDAGNITPDKKNSVKNIKDMLTSYGDLIADGLVEDACAQLSDIYKKVDGKPSPPDKLEGPSLDILQDVIENMLIQDCGGVDAEGECYTDGQCLSGWCDVPVDANHGVCQENNLPNGRSCSDNRQCLSGWCDTHITSTCIPIGLPGYCDDIYTFCPPGYACNPRSPHVCVQI